jgi:hypothetical protein
MRHPTGNFRNVLLILALSAGCLCAACGRQRPADREPQKVEPVSQTVPHMEPLPPPVAVVARATPVPSQGDCAPKYANGLVGTCINNQACRGFGILDASGRAVCACFAKAGGCGQDERCDAMKRGCVPERQPPFGRPRAK